MIESAIGAGYGVCGNALVYGVACVEVLDTCAVSSLLPNG
jgi:hypothetical protein